METIKRLTFKPLAGKRYRCNQTNEITKNPKDYAHSYYGREQNKRNQSRGIVTPKKKKSPKKPESGNYFSNYRSSFGYSNFERRFIHY